MTLSTLLFLLSLAGHDDAVAPVFTPPALTVLSIEPGAEQTLRFELASGTATSPMAYRVLDYAGTEVFRGELRAGGQNRWELTRKFPQGFFEIDLPSSGQRFGVVSLPAWKGKPDTFFAIDGALSWLVKDAARREQLIEAARRCGVSMIRERLSWSSVNPGRDQSNLDGGSHYDALRQFYRDAHMPILELAHDSPAWLGRVRKYPHDLANTASSWAALGRTWAGSWGGLETWNEPDIDFGGNLPADQYVAISKAIGFGLAQAGIDTPIVGGVMAYPHPDFLETCASSGLLDRIDAFSFHTYGTAEGMQKLIEGYRQWLSRSGHRAMPLWITECGRPWKRGPDRPPVAEDQNSTRDIVMKGVEARACGIARYFPFVYPFFVEHTNNFGMTDRSGTPLRSFAAYAQMIRVLANRPFLGDLRHDEPTITRARVFGDDHQTIVVLYSGDQKIDSGASLGLRSRRIEGIDGRVLNAASAGAIPMPDGLSYVYLDHPIEPGRIDRTAAESARPSAAPGTFARPAPSPVVLRLRLDEARLQPSARGYRIKDEPAGTLALAIEVWNLADHPCTTSVGMTLEAAGVQTPQPDHSMTLAARSSSIAEWTVNAGSMLAKAGRVTARLTAHDDSVIQDRLSIVVWGEADLKQTLAQAVHPAALPIGTAQRWTPSHSPGGTIIMDSTSEAAWRLRVVKGQGRDRWAYPVFALPESVRRDQASGLILRGRCSAGATVRVLVWEGDVSRNVVYLTPDSVIPADGRWHVARVSLRDLIPSAANSPDPDGKLDLAKVRHLSVGMNHRTNESTLEVSDLFVTGPSR